MLSVFHCKRKHSSRKYFCCIVIALGVMPLLVAVMYCKQKFAHFLETTYSISKCSSGSKVPFNFAVNDILDHMSRMKKGVSIDENVRDNFLDFAKNFSHQNKSSEEPLKVIVVLHSHNDPGYKQTYSEYFKTFTSKILTLVVEKLLQYKDATFVWPEACFLESWWKIQNISTRMKLKKLVEAGRLEITSGAWVTADEATPHYFAYLDQMIEGHLWVKKHLGVNPISSFDMDQFGYSSSARYLMKEAGIKLSVLKRVQLGMKTHLVKMKLMNLFMKIPGDIYSQGLFSHIEPYEWLTFPDCCGPNRGFCSNMDFGHPGITVPDPNSSEAKTSIHLLHNTYTSLSSFADKVVEQFKLKSAGYLHNVLLLPHGGDFRYLSSIEWDKQYLNTKNLMKYINSNKHYNVDMRFGTLKDFFTEIEKRTKADNYWFPVVNGDFFPFTTRNDYWSGYFSTRQFLKRLGRELQESVRAADILAALVFLNDYFKEISGRSNEIVFKDLVSVRKELGLFQHHDTITGTSSEYVVKDYCKKFTSALTTSHQIVAFLIEVILFGTKSFAYSEKTKAIREAEKDDILNVENPKVSKQSIYPHLAEHLPVMDKVLHFRSESYLILYNMYTQERTEIVDFTYISPNIKIINQISGSTYDFDYMRISKKVRIYFKIRLQPLSITSIKILKFQKNLFGKSLRVKQFKSDNSKFTFCENSQVNMTFSLFDGSPQIMCYRKENFCEPLKISWHHFQENGGAYTLSVTNGNRNINLLKSGAKVRKISGDNRCIVEVTHRLIKTEYILQNTIGVNGRYLKVNIWTDLSRTNVEKFVGEISMKIETTIKNGDTFYTDSNGLQLLKRKFRAPMPFSSNVYPMSSMAAIQDGSRILNIHTGQPLGVVSMKSGTIDLFIDRVSLKLEHGLKEPVTDNKITNTKIFLHFDACTYFDHENKPEIFVPSFDSQLTNDLVQHPIMRFFSIRNIPRDKTSVRFLQSSLPCDMIIANMKTLTEDNFDIYGISLTLFRRWITHYNSKATRRSFQPECKLLSPETLFIKTPSEKFTVKEMTLTHLEWKKNLTALEEIPFRKMDIKTFLFISKDSFH